MIEPRPQQQVDDARYRQLIESITDYAIYMLDPTGRVSSWNPGAQRFKGYTEAEIIGQNFARFYTEEDRAAGLPARALDIARHEGRFEGEGWRVRKDGTRFWVNVVIDPIRDLDGRVIGFAKITRDLTERRETQLALQQARESLFQAQKMEAIGQLTGGVAHDFNNLLMAIISGLELLRRRVPVDPRIDILLKNSMDAANRGVNLARRMLAFARSQELAITEVDLGMLVHGMSDLMQRSIGPAIVIETEIAIGLPAVRADANQVENALLNFTLNARDAMPQGGRIVISARVATMPAGSPTDLAPGDYVCLSVRDTGHGMDEPTLARAAEPFFTTKGIGKGTGLGLSTVHGMAAQLGGRLVLESRVGEGTTAELWLPVADAEASARPIAAAPAKTASGRTPALTILLVDDDRMVLVNTTAMLEECGHRVIAVSSGAQALAAMRAEQHIDLLLTDHAMPQMTGADLAAEARKRQPGLPVLLISGYAELPRDVGRELRRLAKPFSIADLEAAVAGALNNV